MFSQYHRRNPHLCSAGLSVSFWFRFGPENQPEIGKVSSCDLSVVYPIKTNEYYGQSYRVKFNRCREKAFHVFVQRSDRSFTLQWGSTHDASLYEKWNHFMFTYENNYYSSSHGIIMYLNGKKVAQQVGNAATHTYTYLYTYTQWRKLRF